MPGREKTYADAGYTKAKAQSLYDAQSEFHSKGGKYDYSTGEWKWHGQTVGVPGISDEWKKR